jgi:hypothetical protein
MTYAEAATLYEALEARADSRRQRSGGAGDHRAGRSRRRLAYALAACSSVAAAVVIATMLSSAGGARHPSPPARGGGSFGLLGPSPAPIGSNPFASAGRRVTLAHAARLIGADVPTPNAPLANPGNLSVIWGVRGEVILDYVSSQIRISIEPANRILRKGAGAAFRKMARVDHMSPGALTIAGDPGIVVGGSARNPGFAEVVRDGLSVAVMGHRSAAQLVAVARSLTG